MSKKGIQWGEAREELLSDPAVRAAYEAELANPTDDFEIVPVPEEEIAAELDELFSTFDTTNKALSDR